MFLIQHEATEYSGIGKKIIAQNEAVRACGIDIEICSLVIDNSGRYHARKYGGEIFEVFQESNRLVNRLRWVWDYSKILKHIKLHSITFLYIRYTHFANPFFLKFLKQLNEAGVVVYLEIPTYPYDAEYTANSLKRFIHLKLEKLSRSQFHKYIYRIITFSEDERIFDVNTIRLDNGVDVKSTPCRDHVKISRCDFNILVVSSFEFWHGYERLIEGVANYSALSEYPNLQVHFVGHQNTPTSEKYKKLISNHKIARYFTWHGYLTGRSLDELFNLADIAIGVLGGHRKGFLSLNSLKNREYCARGIPFAYSCGDPAFVNKDFALRLADDESPVDIAKLIEWVREGRRNAESIRRYAQDALSWEKQMKKVVNHFMSQIKQ